MDIIEKLKFFGKLKKKNNFGGGVGFGGRVGGGGGSGRGGGSGWM